MESDEPKSCFRGVTLRRGIKYRDLRNYQFSFLEIVWLCEAIRSAHSNGFKKYVDRYNIREKPVREWLRKFRLGTLSDNEFGITVAELRFYRSLADFSML